MEAIDWQEQAVVFAFIGNIGRCRFACALCPNTEEIHTSTGYQAVVNHLLEKVMGQMGSYGTGVFGESTVSR